VRAFRSAGRLTQNIDNQLKGNVVGYVALVGHSHAVASGAARTAADLMGIDQLLYLYPSLEEARGEIPQHNRQNTELAGTTRQTPRRRLAPAGIQHR
jgi:hypothetical protein